jgi:hypothetical protein
LKLIYLSAPFTTGPDPVEKRQADIDKATGFLMKHSDVYVFSPITYERPIKEVIGVDSDKNVEWDFWRPRDQEMVSRCDELWVLTLVNWEASRGVTFEVNEARRLEKPIRYVHVRDNAYVIDDKVIQNVAEPTAA